MQWIKPLKRGKPNRKSHCKNKKLNLSASYFIAQEFIEGESVSVSLLATKNKALAISLNRQNIAMTGPEAFSSYNGGCVPLDHPFKQEAFDLAEKVVKSIYGLWGYVGVDLVLALDMPYVVDVNPRLTTSYVGLRKVVNFNLAKAIENAVLKGNLPDRPENRGIACFLKTETPKPTMVTFKNISQTWMLLFLQLFLWKTTPNHVPF